MTADPKLVEAITTAIHEAECTAYTHEGRNARCEREAKAVAAVIEPLIVERIMAEREGWASWIDSWTGAITPEPCTPEAIATWLRSGLLPFGCYTTDTIPEETP